MQKRHLREIKHFTKLDHVWWGLKTVAGQRRYDNKIKLFKKFCKNRKNIKILEVGCGNGEFTKRLVKILKPSSKLIAIDITPRLIQKGEETVKNQNLLFKLEDIESMTFTKESFDIVCGISILHHVDFKKAFREIYRVLKRDGEIFFTEPNMLNPNILLGLHLPFLREKMEFSPDETALIKWQILNCLKEIGFRNTQVKNYDFLHPKTPRQLISIVEKLGNFIEKLPILKEFSGSLIIYARK